MEGFIFIIFIICAFIIIPAIIIKSKKEIKSSQQYESARRSAKYKEDEQRFKNGEMSPSERAAYAKKKIEFAEMAYRGGQLTLMELELVKKKYSDNSMIDVVGLNVTAAVSKKDQINRKITEQQKRAENRLIFNTALGEATGGIGGAIVGAVDSAQRNAKETITLETEKNIAEQEYRKAIEDSVKNKR